MAKFRRGDIVRSVYKATYLVVSSAIRNKNKKYHLAHVDDDGHIFSQGFVDEYFVKIGHVKGPTSEVLKFIKLFRS